MRQRFDAATTQAQKLALLRRYGWGIPDLNRALLSASNDATLMVEDAFLPFRKDGSSIKTRHMNLHQLPWPRDELADVGELEVELRITLSYFVEPNPGERGWTRRHRYASHNLRFAVKRSLETLQDFRQRINRAAQDEEDAVAVPGGADDWIVGPIRDRGSIHSDIWRGTAAALAERDAIGVFPISGWWKEKPSLQRWDRSARYALLVSIKAHDAEVEISTRLQIRSPWQCPPHDGAQISFRGVALSECQQYLEDANRKLYLEAPLPRSVQGQAANLLALPCPSAWPHEIRMLRQCCDEIYPYSTMTTNPLRTCLIP